MSTFYRDLEAKKKKEIQVLGLWEHIPILVSVHAGFFSEVWVFPFYYS